MRPPPAGNGAGATILYVDDEEMARKYFGRVFGSDYRILTAPHAEAALEVLARAGSAVDVLVTDYRMPGRLGGALLRDVERRYPHIVRILVTAFADKDVLLDAINGGAPFRVLEKPFDMGQVRAVLQLASQDARARAARRDSLLAIEETLAFLAHELNTPLATIANFARGIQRRLDGGGVPLPALQAEIADAASHMNGNARYCLAVLATFVDSVRQAGAGPAAPGGSKASELIGALLDAYPLSPAQRAAIALDCRQDFIISALPNCVALVLSSILSNALRALHGQDAPALRFTVLAERRRQIRIDDNGSGIPPDILGRLLIDPVTMHADAGGSGWGMLFCQRIMQSFGGAIEVDSEQGRGTTVTLNFPEHRRNEHD